MSHIFDALQKSEGARPGIDSSVPPVATELLRRAEHRTASKWEAADLLKQIGAAENAGLDNHVAPQTNGHDVHLLEAPAEEERSPADEEVDVFRQFQSLPVTIPTQSRLVCFSDEDSLAAEAFRLLGVRLRHLRRDRPLKKVLVTSTIPQEGKSMVAANLASTLALRTQQKTLLLEGDLRRPSLSNKFGIAPKPGICQCLQGELTLEKSIYYLKGPGLWILPAGDARSNPLELLQSRKLSEVMEQLTVWFDWIVIDSPPVLPLADTSVWARLADGILLVTRQGTTEKRHLQRGLEALEQKKLIGALLNCSSTSAHSDYYYRPLPASQPSEEAAK